jgi:Small-conductance mechanosensitive channel
MKPFLQVILLYQVNVGVIEIVIFLMAGLVLGFFIHFFLVSRRTMSIKLPKPPPIHDSSLRQIDEWRLKYQEEMEVQEKIQMQLRRQIDEARENEELLSIEIEELHKEIDKLRNQPPPEPEPAPAPVPHVTSQEMQSEEYLQRLQKAQESLTEQNQNIARLLDQIELLKQTEFRHIDTMKAKEELESKLSEAEKLLSEKDNRILQLQQQLMLAGEMEERLQKAYEEFNALRETLSKLETMTQPQNRQFEFDELQQSHQKLVREFDESKQKQMELLEENQRLSRLLTDTEEKLRESNFQRQQLQKKIGFLEDLNHELQRMSEHNKKLESQLRRMSEIETMLARVSGKTPGQQGGSKEIPE